MTKNYSLEELKGDDFNILENHLNTLEAKIDSAYNYVLEDSLTDEDYTLIRRKLTLEYRQILNEYRDSKSILTKNETEIIQTRIHVIELKLNIFSYQNKEDAQNEIKNQNKVQKQVTEECVPYLEFSTKLKQYFDKCFRILDKHKDNLNTERAEKFYNYLGSLIACAYESVPDYKDEVKEVVKKMPDVTAQYLLYELEKFKQDLCEYIDKSKDYKTLYKNNPYVFFTEEDFYQESQRLGTGNKDKPFLFFCMGILTLLLIIVNLYKTKSTEELYNILNLFVMLFSTLTIAISANGFMNDEYKRDLLKETYQEYFKEREDKKLKLESIKNKKLRIQK